MDLIKDLAYESIKWNSLDRYRASMFLFIDSYLESDPLGLLKQITVPLYGPRWLVDTRVKVMSSGDRVYTHSVRGVRLRGTWIFENKIYGR